MQLAEDAGIDKLQSLYFTTPPNSGGYFVVDRGGDKALGCSSQIVSRAFKGWEFENHYRVKDTTTGAVYDPTFGTSSAAGGNPPGYKATSETTNPAKMEMTPVYAGRYQVTRKGMQATTVELNKKPASPAQVISDASFMPNAMDNLR